MIILLRSGGGVENPPLIPGEKRRWAPLLFAAVSPHMKTRLSVSLAAALLCLVPAASPLLAQAGAGPVAQYVIKDIKVSTPNTPEFQTTAQDAQAKRSPLSKWIEVEVEFSATARSPEINFKYFIVLGGQMLTGEQTLVDVPAGQSLFTVMYIAPRTITTLLKGQPLNPGSVTNAAVQILRSGVNAPAAVKMLKEAGPFYNTMQQVPGLVLLKQNTPFAPLWWDRYEQVRPPGAR